LSFFYGQDSLTIIQWIIRAVIAFFTLLIAAKALGQRAISQLRLLDFIIAIILGNILAHPLSDEGLGMTGSITTTIVLVVLYYASLFLTLKSSKLERFLSPAPLTIIRNGQIIHKNLTKARITLDFLLSELRVDKVDDIKKIAVALWEPGGRISIFLDSAYQTLTPNDMKIATNPFSLPTVVIKDGNIEMKALKKINRSKDWLVDTLRKTYKANVKAVLLATIDSSNNIQVYFK
jgi:uncharacterized membrane protein YcaP (DUF421 family)